MNLWHEQTASIQSEFFRTGKYTHLWIDPSVADGKLKWKYWFSDLGMCHAIESEHPVSNASKEQVFGGRYRAFLRTLHRDLMGDCVCHECCEAAPQSSMPSNQSTI